MSLKDTAHGFGSELLAPQLDSTPNVPSPIAGEASSSIRGHLSAVLASSLGVQAIGMIRSFAIPVLLTPIQYGTWRLVLILWQYGAYLHLGSFAFLNRELPGLLATRDRVRFVRLRRDAFWGTMTVTAVVASVLMTIGLLPSIISGVDVSALPLVALGLIALQVSLYVLVQLRIESRFGKMSLQGFTEALLGLVLMLPLARIAGLRGLTLGLIVATAVAAALFANRGMFDRPTLKWPNFGRQVLEGAPLSALSFLNGTIASVGQVIVASILGIEAAGYYGLGLMLGMVVYAVPNALGMVVYPRYLTSYATSTDGWYISYLLRRSVRATTIACTTAVSICALLISPLYYYVFPKYVAAVATSYALVAMMPFVAYALVLQNALIALRKHSLVIAIQIGAVCLSACLSYAGAILSRNVAWAAAGVMVANTFSGSAMLWLGLASTRTEGDSVFREIVAELAPVVLVGGITFGLIRLQAVFARTTTLWLSAVEVSVFCAVGLAVGLKSLRGNNSFRRAPLRK